MKIFALLSSILLVNAQRRIATVYITNSQGGFSIVDGVMDNKGAAYGYFDNALNKTGWGKLEIVTPKQAKSEMLSDSNRMLAAGILEGYLTADQIYSTFRNTCELRGLWGNVCNGLPTKLANWVATQRKWADGMVAKNPQDPFWMTLDGINKQVDGLSIGYNNASSKQNVPKLGGYAFLFLNLVGDLLDLMSVLDKEMRIDWMSLSPEEFFRIQSVRGRCSALVKVTPELDNLFIGHSSWFIFQNMNRIYKMYRFNYRDLNLPTSLMVFSSYPGYLESLDDFYMMDSGLAMLQTTNEVPNSKLYDKCVPQSLYAFQRVRLANAMASSGRQWYEIVSRYNSGTYNNQYMLIDYKRFQVGKPLPSDFLWVVEQIPGLVYGEDKTDVVERGYWASYNVPALAKIYNESGYPEFVKRVGSAASYDLAPRARIFRRDANDVQTLDDYKKIMRYNNYLKDPIENHDPDWAICARGDLRAMDPGTGGCYDSKVAELSMILKMTAQVKNGPTNDDLPTFSWEPKWHNVSHYGLPLSYNFDWVTMSSEFSG